MWSSNHNTTDNPTGSSFSEAVNSVHLQTTMKFVHFALAYILFITNSDAFDEDSESVTNLRMVTKDYCEWKYVCCNQEESLSNCPELCFKSLNCTEPNTENPPPNDMTSRFSLWRYSFSRLSFGSTPMVCPEGYRPDHRNRCRLVFTFQDSILWMIKR